jgi:hypothetical protein
VQHRHNLLKGKEQMSDTAIRQTGAGQFCGNCGAPVKVYWNSCPACDTPIEPTAVGSFTPAAAPAGPRWGSASGLPASTSETQIVAPETPAPGVPGSGGPNYGTPRRSYGTALPSPSYSAPQPSYTPPATSFRSPLEDYQPPSSFSSTTAQFPSYQAPPSYQPSPSLARPQPATSGSGPSWMMVIIGVLVLLLIGAGVFAGITSSSLSSKNSKLKNETTLYNKANQALGQAQTQLGTANATISNQSSQISSYKTCLNDFNTFFSDIDNNPNVIPVAAARAVTKDCIPLGFGG